MSNTSKGKALKGSKFWMQQCATVYSNSICGSLGEELKWISPVPENEYEEYSLNNIKVLTEIGLNNTHFSFWPARQPQWDAIAIGKITKTLYLFEAKSYPAEMETSCSATSLESLKLIEATLKATSKLYGEYNELWKCGYYQLANRLAFLSKLKELKDCGKKYSDVVLVLLNVVNDNTWDKDHQTTKEKWKEAYAKVYEKMTISFEKLKQNGVIELFCEPTLQVCK